MKEWGRRGKKLPDILKNLPAFFVWNAVVSVCVGGACPVEGIAEAEETVCEYFLGVEVVLSLNLLTVFQSYKHLMFHKLK